MTLDSRKRGNRKHLPAITRPVLFSAAAFLWGGALGVFAGGIGRNLALAAGAPAGSMLYVSNAFAGVFLGGFCLELKLRRDDLRRIHADRSRKIADMNYILRNAVSVLAFYGRRCSDQNAPRSIADAVDRVDWALKELLPYGWGAIPPASHTASSTRQIK